MKKNNDKPPKQKKPLKPLKQDKKKDEKPKKAKTFKQQALAIKKLQALQKVKSHCREDLFEAIEIVEKKNNKNLLIHAVELAFKDKGVLLAILKKIVPDLSSIALTGHDGKDIRVDLTVHDHQLIERIEANIIDIAEDRQPFVAELTPKSDQTGDA